MLLATVGPGDGNLKADSGLRAVVAGRPASSRSGSRASGSAPSGSSPSGSSRSASSPSTRPALPSAPSPFRTDLFSAKTVVVTGGATGIGFAIASAFARHGAKVVVVSRNAANLKAATSKIGPSATFHVADVRDAKALEAVATALERVDVLVNCAAGNFPSPFDALSENAWKTVIDIVLHGTANTCRALRPKLASDASIINIGAGYAWTGAPGVAHSGAAKAGVLNLTKTLAVEWAPVRVNAVSPGPIDGTEGMKRLADDLGLRQEAERLVPLRRFGAPSEIADACLYLAGPAASYVTGSCLVADGGMDAKGPFADLLLG